MLKVDANLRRLCGFKTADNVANESKFSPAFAEFAMGELPRPVRRHHRSYAERVPGRPHRARLHCDSGGGTIWRTSATQPRAKFARAKVSARKTHSQQPRQQKLEAEVAKAYQAIRVSIGLPGSVHRWDSEQSKPMQCGSAMKASGKGDSEKLISRFPLEANLLTNSKLSRTLRRN